MTNALEEKVLTGPDEEKKILWALRRYNDRFYTPRSVMLNGTATKAGIPLWKVIDYMISNKICMPDDGEDALRNLEIINGIIKERRYRL